MRHCSRLRLDYCTCLHIVLVSNITVDSHITCSAKYIIPISNIIVHSYITFSADNHRNQDQEPGQSLYGLKQPSSFQAVCISSMLHLASSVQKTFSSSCNTYHQCVEPLWPNMNSRYATKSLDSAIHHTHSAYTHASPNSPGTNNLLLHTFWHNRGMIQTCSGCISCEVGNILLTTIASQSPVSPPIPPTPPPPPPPPLPRPPWSCLHQSYHYQPHLHQPYPYLHHDQFHQLHH